MSFIDDDAGDEMGRYAICQKVNHQDPGRDEKHTAL